MIIKLFTNIILIIFLLITSSCSNKISKIFPNRPDLEIDLGDTSPDFKKGFDDGCEAGMSAGSNTFYKMFYRSNQIDGYKMAASGDYKSAWGIGWWYCYRYDFNKQKSGLYGSFFGGYR